MPNLKPCPIAQLLDALETCHICGGILHLEDWTPTHCENCSWDCDEHEEPQCSPLWKLHRDARAALGDKDARIAELEAEVARLTGLYQGALAVQEEILHSRGGAG